MIALIIILAYVANFFLNRWLLIVLCRKLKTDDILWIEIVVCLLPIIGTLSIIIVIGACTQININIKNFFLPKEYRTKK